VACGLLRFDRPGRGSYRQTSKEVLGARYLGPYYFMLLYITAPHLLPMDADDICGSHQEVTHSIHNQHEALTRVVLRIPPREMVKRMFLQSCRDDSFRERPRRCQPNIHNSRDRPRVIRSNQKLFTIQNIQ